MPRAAPTAPRPFLAVLWLHTIHLPRGALPEWYHNYSDAFGDPAGDYLGSISQMDVQVGRLRAMLQQKGIANDTMLWYTSDNGPDARGQDVQGEHVVGARDRSDRPEFAATNGLRQCKGSLYEGGTRVPGILEVRKATDPIPNESLDSQILSRSANSCGTLCSTRTEQGK